jgi:hypothetical protein
MATPTKIDYDAPFSVVFKKMLATKNMNLDTFAYLFAQEKGCSLLNAVGSAKTWWSGAAEPQGANLRIAVKVLGYAVTFTPVRAKANVG